MSWCSFTGLPLHLIAFDKPTHLVEAFTGLSLSVSYHIFLELSRVYTQVLKNFFNFRSTSI